MHTTVMFSRATDEWATPQALYAELHAEFGFACDCAASRENAKSDRWFGPDHPEPERRDALAVPWGAMTCWLNPPYSQCRAFLAKASVEAAGGATVVCLVPARTDTRWWHDYVWDREQHTTRPGVEIRFLKGRLKFGQAAQGAPFPSVVIIFRPPAPGGENPYEEMWKPPIRRKRKAQEDREP